MAAHTNALLDAENDSLRADLRLERDRYERLVLVVAELAKPPAPPAATTPESPLPDAIDAALTDLGLYGVMRLRHEAIARGMLRDGVSVADTVAALRAGGQPAEVVP